MKVRVITNLIVLASFVSRMEITVDEQLSEAEAPPLADDIKPGY